MKKKSKNKKEEQKLGVIIAMLSIFSSFSNNNYNHNLYTKYDFLSKNGGEKDA